MSNKILLWRMKEMCEKLNQHQLAVIFIKLSNAHEPFKSEKTYEDGILLLSEEGFYNAVKMHTSIKINKFKQEIKMLRKDESKEKFIKIHKTLEIKIENASKNYDKFDLSFDDVLFATKSFEDKNQKKLIKKYGKINKSS